MKIIVQFMGLSRGQAVCTQLYTLTMAMSVGLDVFVFIGKCCLQLSSAFQNCKYLIILYLLYCYNHEKTPILNEFGHLFVLCVVCDKSLDIDSSNRFTVFSAHRNYRLTSAKRESHSPKYTVVIHVEVDYY